MAVAVVLSAVGGVCLPLRRLDCLPWLCVLARLSAALTDWPMALADDLAVSAWLSFVCSLGARQRRRSSFPGREPSAPGFKEVDQAHPATAPTGHETNQGSAGDLGDEAAGAGERARLVAHRRALIGVRGMRQSSDAAAASAVQGEREENRWIKSRFRFDLKDMRTDPIRKSVRAFGARAGLRQTDGCAAHF